MSPVLLTLFEHSPLESAYPHQSSLESAFEVSRPGDSNPLPSVHFLPPQKVFQFQFKSLCVLTDAQILLMRN